MPLADKIEVRHDASTPLIKGNTDEERKAAAAALARKLNAHIVVYGNVTSGQSADDLQVEFYVSPQASQDEFAALLGSQALGGDLSLPADYDGSGSLTNISVSEQLDLRSRIIFWLTVALTQDLLGRSEQALATLQQAETELADWQPGDGKELLYFFQGREHLFLRQLDEARAAFARAVDTNPAYARAAVALGSVDAVTSNETEASAAQLADGSLLQQAIAAQTAGLAEAEAAGDSFTAALARAALAQSLDVACIAAINLGQFDDAAKSCQQALNYADQAVAYFGQTQENRLFAQALLGQGLAHFGLTYVHDARGDRPQALLDADVGPGRLRPVHRPGRSGAVRQGASRQGNRPSVPAGSGAGEKQANGASGELIMSMRKPIPAMLAMAALALLAAACGGQPTPDVNAAVQTALAQTRRPRTASRRPSRPP